MEAPSKFRPVRLADYLIERGAGSDPKVQADIFSKIYSGEIPAALTVHPASLPLGASTTAVLRHAMSTASEPREVPALSHAKAKAEIRKAALGRDADFDLLDSLTLLVPTTAIEVSVPMEEEGSAENSVPARAAMPIKRKSQSVKDKRVEAILRVIEKMGMNRYALNGPTKIGGRDGDRARIFRELPPDAMGKKEMNDADAFDKAFENAWGHMLKERIIIIAKEVTPAA